MEERARLSAEHGGLRLLLGRIANLYGPGQRLTKPQGLISQICLTHATGRPLPVYVSTDTMRDYIYAPDAAAVVVAGLQRLTAELPPGEVVIKILASGMPVTVGHLLGEARRVLHRPLRTIPLAGPGVGQVLDLRFRSRVWTDLDAFASTPLPAGLAGTAADVLRRVSAGGDLDAEAT
jgi:UDP-glucose 4-epimerase